MGQNIHITILVDNTAARADLKNEHGLSLWIEYEGRTILFDVGQGDAIFHNATALGLNLEKVEAIVLSHGHYDHTGPLAEVLTHISKANIFVHPDALSTRFSRKVTGVHEIGMSHQNQILLRHLAQRQRVIWTSGPSEIFPGVIVTGQIPRHTIFEDTGGAVFTDEQCTAADALLDDQALFFETRQGLVVVLGCAHAGVVNTLDYVTKLIDQRSIYAIIGGMHLVNANLARIEHTIEAYKKYDIQKIMPLHCTGQEAAGTIQKAFGQKCIISGTGAKIGF
jgi:7,8-dihydropterin-6-yl-methyl-4-(beta-D-ribofuranosyl)aminobenzene 5'-phosphate synthase